MPVKPLLEVGGGLEVEEGFAEVVELICGEGIETGHEDVGYAAGSAAEYAAPGFEQERMLMELTLTPVFQKVTEGYIGFVEELPGA